MKKSLVYPLVIVWLVVCVSTVAALSGLLTREIASSNPPPARPIDEPAADRTKDAKSKALENELELACRITQSLDEQGRVTLVFEFNRPIISDKELIFRQLTTAELPFTIEPPLGGEAIWSDVNTLRLSLPFSLAELEKRLAVAPSEIRWDGGFTDVRKHPLARVLGFEASSGKSLEIVDSVSAKDSPGRPLINRINLQPFAVKAAIGRRPSGVQVVVNFNRPMVNPDEIKKNISGPNMPFVMTPQLPFSGSWTTDRSFQAIVDLEPEKFWDQVTDQGFFFQLKEGLAGLTGEKAPPAKLEGIRKSPFYIELFQPLELRQTALDLNGWVYFDLMFNKPVDHDQLAVSLQAERLVRHEPGPNEDRQANTVNKSFIPTSIEVTKIGGPGDPYGTRAEVRVKAQVGEEIKVIINDLVSRDGRGMIRGREFKAMVESYFEVAETRLHQQDYFPWQPYFVISLRESFDFRNIENFIRLDPPLPFTTASYDSSGRSLAIHASFSTQTPTKVILLKGMRTDKGLLTEDMSFTVKASKNYQPQLLFTGRGRYLSQNKPLLVKVAGRNLPKVRLQAWRIYENNLPLLINVQEYNPSTRSRMAMQFSKNVIDLVTEVGGPEGDVFERLIDLKPLLPETSVGSYMLKISPVQGEADDNNDDDTDYYYDHYDYHDYYSSPERYLPVVISDIGLVAHSLPGRLAVWANHLGSARPVARAQVRFYDSANQIINEGTTDDTGFFQADLPVDQVVFVTVEKDGDLNYLVFKSGRQSHYDYDDDYYWDWDNQAKWYTSGDADLKIKGPSGAGRRDYLGRGYEAFVFMPRDIFKPGETLKVKALIRDKDLLPPSASFPVLWRVYDPDGRVLGQGKAGFSAQGGLDFALEIPFSARTGAYRVALNLPESSNVLGSADFTVEDFVPPRLKVELEAQPKVYYGDGPEIKVAARARYLFGALGSGLNWEMDAVISEAAYNPAGWEGFDFSRNQANFETIRQRRIAKGKLDEEGRAQINQRLDWGNNSLPAKLNVALFVSVQEDGGRWNAQRTLVEYFPHSLILGSKKPAKIAINQPFAYEVVALNEAGQGADIKALDVQIFRVSSRYYNTYRNGRVYRQSVEEMDPLAELKAPLAGGRGSFEFLPNVAGVYEIIITEPESGLKISRRHNIYGLEAAGEEAPDNELKLSFDKPNYRPGETARLQIKAPYDGRLLVTVETDKLLHSQSLNITGREAEVLIPVSAEIKANAYVTATVLRPLTKGEGAHRAIGVVSLEIDRALNRLQVEIDSPSHFKPGAKAALKIRLADEFGQPTAGEATVALVDEGVLDLTGFKTPDPWAMFTANYKLITRFYDLYEQLLPLEEMAVPFLTPGGGDGIGRAGLFSPFKRKQEVLSIFIATVEVDQSGEAEVELDLPEYSGQGRLMVTAAGRDRFGSAAKSVRLSRDLTVEATLPLALAPGDSFAVPVRLFLDEQAPPEAGREAEITIRTEGPIQLLEPADNRFNLAPGTGETVVYQALARPAEKTDGEAGLGRLIVESRSGLGERFSQTLEVAVRSPFPRVSQTVSRIMDGPKEKITIPEDGYLKGTVEASLSLTRSPAIEAARAVNYLQNYPYGCLEQTISKAWMFLAADDLMAGLNPDEATSEYLFYGLNTAVKRLVTMQTAKGSFSVWPGGGEAVYEWGSVYAAHFLTEAARKIELPYGLHQDALKWVRAYLGAGYSGSDQDASYILATKAYACYVLALNGEYQAGWVNSLKDRYDGLAPSARILLAGAEAINEGHARALVELEKQELDMNYHNLSARYSSLDSGPRNLALKLMVWNEVDPLAATTKKLAGLVAEQGRKNLWRNTQENGLAVLSLGNYLMKSATGKPYRATLTSAAGEILMTSDHKQLGSVGPKALNRALGRPLTLSLEGEGRPYYTLIVAGVPVSPPPPKSQGLSLDRTWIMEDGTEHRLSGPDNLDKPLRVAKGDRVSVRITVKAVKNIQNMVLVDLLPGGFEIENPRLTPESVEPGKADNIAGENQSAGSAISPHSSRIELREDRIVLIEPWFNRKQATYRYTMRAITPGDYILPPTMAEGMYEPDYQAILGSGRIIVTE